MKFIKILFLIISASFAANAQSSVFSDSVYILDSVVISASRTAKSIFNIPYSVDQLNEEEIQKGKAGLSLQEILDEVPGLIVNDRNNPSLGDRISIRGIGSRSSFGVRGIKILYDGIPLTLPDGQAQLNNIDLSSSGSIEILKGPASTLYGNAAGGVINIESEIPKNDSVSFHTSGTAGSFGMQNYNLKMKGNIKDFSYLFSVSNQTGNGFRDHSAFKAYNLNSNISYNFFDLVKLKAIFNYYESPYLLNPSSLNKTDAEKRPTFVRDFIKAQGAGEQASQFQYGISADFNFKKNINGKLIFYFADRELVNPIPGRIIKLGRSVIGFRSIITRTFSSGDFTLNISAGVDIESQDDLREEYNNPGLTRQNLSPDEIFNNLNYGNVLLNQKEKVSAAGPFLSTEIQLNPKLLLNAGVRYDQYTFRIDDNFRSDGDDTSERDMINFSPMLGIVYLPSPFIKLYANYVTSFQTPTTSELSNSPSGEGGFNPSLNPEEIESYEVGLFSLLKNFNTTLEASFFLMNFNDMLISYQSELSGSEEIFFRNAGVAENKGVEFKSKWSPSGSLTITTAYSFMQFIFKDYLAETEPGKFMQLNGKEVPGIPKNIFFAKVLYEPFSYITAEIKFQWYDSYYVNDFNGPLPGIRDAKKNYINDAYFKIDLTAGYSFNLTLFSGGIFAGINNIMNSQYSNSIVPNAAGERFFEPAPGRNWYLKLNINF